MSRFTLLSSLALVLVSVLLNGTPALAAEFEATEPGNSLVAPASQLEEQAAPVARDAAPVAATFAAATGDGTSARAAASDPVPAEGAPGEVTRGTTTIVADRQPASDGDPEARPTPVATPPVQSESTAAGAGQPAFVREDQPFKLRDYEEPKPAAQAPWWQQVLGFAFKLVLVIGLIFASLGALKKFSGGRITMPSANKGRNMVVLETTHLGPQQNVHLISLGGERLLVVGTSPQGVTKLAEITDPAQVRPFLNQNRPNGSAFNQMYDIESVGVDHPQDLFQETLREVGDRYGGRRS